ncbi:PREDICTED: WD repeat and HMG-box DNA-binding protein 1 isoform X1 [Lepidothrix coronata]|uniref:WD repeat and HMG-box DNA-binding protein 1 n=1 Tax=Lepidothrix coronata TaxID=321398 RepID=A0A6J0J092_9PASS|nr:PREDICTED: WD repeat and HMG-box DNA-binding protein 1 isoform X1 [Lepidothrix coronata]XP_017692301.1 PREDICTED: WD repeat and HMG-box DNA-binding protein 1 isoform X1 [Lepidothrix coronata]
MPSARKPMRYGHSEGHTEVCFDDTGSCIVTCGSDGDVRIWENLDDDDPKSINVGEKAYSCALKNGRLITAVSNNTVQIHTFPEGAPDGILTRFTMHANHVTFSSGGTKIAAGSSDFMIKVVEVTDSSKQKTFRGHEAPVLSLSFDPKDVYLASASCDGSVRVWKIEDQTCTTSWQLLQKCNDVINAKSICRLGWQPGTGKLLAVPVDKVVKLYRRETWDSQLDLSDASITLPLNVVAWSPCGQYLAAGSVDGSIVVWNVETQECIERMKHEKNYSICGLAWHPKYKQVAYTDTEGNLGLLENVGVVEKPKDKVASAVAKDYNDLFDGDDDDYFNGDMVEPQSSPNPAADEDDDGDLMLTSGRPRRAIIDEDDNSLDIGLIKASSSLLEKEEDGDDQTGGFSALPPSSTQQHFYDGPMPTPKQRPFQSGSTPAHLMHRFMVWNSVGIIRCYNDEQDNAIDVEFHDTSVHHATHLPNSLNHTMADLSAEAILLACEGTEELASKLHCIHFGSWDANKEWTVDMPKDEDIEAICLGQGWAACATSAFLVRVFTVGGVQREIFSLPGPVVSMAGHGEQLMIIYHRGTGFDGDQCLGVQLMELGKKKRQILHGDPLSLTRKSYLVWVGFSAEGTPCYVDSEGIVRMLNRGLGNTWIPVCNTREQCKGKSDHYWVVGIHENPQQLRCIPCKGSRFPPTLPRPAVAILPFQLPYCQVTTEKGQMEEQYWRSVVFQNHVDYLSKNGYEFDESAKNQAVKEQQELLMKLFALSCKLEREFRCVELADLMAPNVVSLAIKYASRSRRINLAQRLSQLAVEKATELATAQGDEEEEEEEEEEDFRKHLSAGYSSSATEWGQLPVRNVQQDQEVEDAEETDACEEAEETPEVHKQRPNPFSKGVTSAEVTTPKSAVLGSSSSQGRVNPFKVSSNKKDPVVPSANVLDTMSRYSKKTSLSGSRAVNKQNPPVIKPLIPKPKSKQASATSFFQPRTLTPNPSEKAVEEREGKAVEEREGKAVEDGEGKAGNESHEVKVTAQENTENRRPRTGFQMWLEENRANILTDNPDLNEAEVIKEGMSRFRMLTSEERMVWTEKAKGGAVNGLAEDKKRKRPTADEGEGRRSQEEKSEDTNASKKSKPLDQSTNGRLSAFAFKQS